MHVVGIACVVGSMAISSGARAQTAPAGATQTTSVDASSGCDPYKNYGCLDDYLGQGFWQRLTNYYKLEWGQATGPADPSAPASRRDRWRE